VPVFLCRWPNGDCSKVLAARKADAVEKLDEVANAEGCPMVELSEAQVHFALTVDGQLVLDGLGEGTEQDIFEFCYPALGEALADRKDVVRAVQLERDRGKDDQAETEAPATELGRRTKAELDMPTTIINRMVSKAAKRRLRSFKPPGKRVDGLMFEGQMVPTAAPKSPMAGKSSPGRPQLATTPCTGSNPVLGASPPV
jgi:hypothetical protein